ncbi:MAG: PP2C family protein-serine/threonine phosphatase [Micrococcales bacterium]
MAITTKAYAASNIGKIRKSNQDSGYSGFNFFFVADGMGGHAGGDVASAIISQSVATSDRDYESADIASAAVVDSLLAANEKLSQTVIEHPELKGMGTTFSGITVTGDLITTTHIGDSRIYLVSNSKLQQISKDHTFVQRLIDTGRITPEEALVHPRRNVLMRVLGDVEIEPEIDTETYKAQVGDRWMLCSDGLCGVVPAEIIESVLANKTVDAEEASELLVYEALEHGAPDNVTVVVVDILPAEISEPTVPYFVGSAENEVVIAEHKGRSLVRVFNPRALIDLFARKQIDAEFAIETEELLERIMKETRAKVRWRRVRQLLLAIILIVGSVFLLKSAYDYTQTRYYISQKDGYVVIYQGIRESFGPLHFSHVFQTTNIEVVKLTAFQQDLVSRSISGESLSDIQEKLTTLIEVGN